MRNPMISNAFPKSFLDVCDSVWAQDANRQLMGAAQSLQNISHASERKALDYMVSTLHVKPFLTEVTIASLVFAAPGGRTGRTVDLVALDQSGHWVLVEAKSQIDSATLRGQPPVEKFGHTLSQLTAFYGSARVPAPRLSRAIITATGGVQISGNSSWSVGEGKLYRDGVAQAVGPALVPIEVIEI